MQGMTHPTKEQVRAYMQLRGSAHRPPPSPAEIRRQLGWSLIHAQPDAGSDSQYAMLPGQVGQLAVLLTLEWMFSAVAYTS